MAKKKIVKKTKSTARAKNKRVGDAGYTIEHDFIIIAGGGLVVLLLMVFFFLSF